MEIETIKDDAKKPLIELLNKGLQVEYGFILNYPRLIENITMVDSIHDEQLNDDIERLGKQSVQHFGWIDRLITELGGESMWQIETADRVVDVEKVLEKQLGKEKAVLSLYEQAKCVAERNKVKIKVRDYFGKFIRIKDELEMDVVNASDIITTLDRIISDEQRHIKMVHDSIATLNMLMNK